MAQSFFSGDELDRMKSDAIRRARQMHSRSAIPNLQQGPVHNEKPQTNERKESQESIPHPKNRPTAMQNILQMIKMMGFESDQLILIALILMLSGEEDNMLIILALLYIAM